MIRNFEAVLYDRGIMTQTPMAGDSEKWMSKEQAIAWLHVWRDFRVPKYNLGYSKISRGHIDSGTEAVFVLGLLNELIERIRNSNHDPITEVARFYYEMDDILANSDDDHKITHLFAGFMENESHQILSFLMRKEKETRR